MRPTQQEFANPREWLARLAEDSDGYRRLVRESGGSGRAAYRLARAQCSVTLGSEPRLEDLQSAAVLLASRVGSGGTLPIQSLLPGSKSAPPLPRSAPPVARSAPPVARSAPPVANAAQAVAHSAPPVARSLPPVVKPAPPAATSSPTSAAPSSNRRGAAKSRPTPRDVSV